MEDRERPMTWLDRFCIFMVGVAGFISISLLFAVFLALAIVVGNTGR